MKNILLVLFALFSLSISHAQDTKQKFYIESIAFHAGYGPTYVFMDNSYIGFKSFMLDNICLAGEVNSSIGLDLQLNAVSNGLVSQGRDLHFSNFILNINYRFFHTRKVQPYIGFGLTYTKCLLSGL